MQYANYYQVRGDFAELLLWMDGVRVEKKVVRVGGYNRPNFPYAIVKIHKGSILVDFVLSISCRE